MPGGSDGGAAAKDMLPAHELAVVFTDGPGGWLKSRVRPVCARGPLLYVVVELAHLAAARCWCRGAGMEADWGETGRRLRGRHYLPLGLGRQAGSGPASVGVGLVVADMDDRCVRVTDLAVAQSEDRSDAVAFRPVQGSPLAIGPVDGPSIGEPQVGPVVPAIGHELQPFPGRHRLSARAKGSSRRRWRGVSLSKAKPSAKLKPPPTDRPVSVPTSIRPPGWYTQPRVGALSATACTSASEDLSGKFGSYVGDRGLTPSRVLYVHE